MPSPIDIVDQTLTRIANDPELRQLSSTAMAKLRMLIVEAVASENEACMMNLWNASEGDERDAMIQRFQDLSHLSNPPKSSLDTTFWTRWYPGLDIDDMTVESVLNTLPGLNEDEVPAIIRAFENPDSPLKLPGACSLKDHDVLHVLLGRGLVDQDEAFVLGFTAVTDPAFSDRDIEKYKIAFSLYPEPYCIRGCDLIAFDLGVAAARKMRLKNLSPLDVTFLRKQTVRQARDYVGIDKTILYETYEEEQRLIPGTPWSKRLTTRSMT